MAMIAGFHARATLAPKKEPQVTNKQEALVDSRADLDIYAK